MGLLTKVTDTLGKRPAYSTAAGGLVLAGGIWLFVKYSSRPQPTAAVADIMHQISDSQDTQLQQQIHIVERKDPITGKILPSQERVEARAFPNQRLRATFGVHNIFTSTDVKYNTGFRKDAVQKMQDAMSYDPGTRDVDWSQLILFIHEAVEKKLSLNHTRRPLGIREDHRPDEIPLAELAQFVTLEVSLRYLFPESAFDYSEPATVTTLAKKINDLWLQSKSEHLPLWKDQTDVHELLQDITSQDPLDPKENPMNFILPAYETMWRVVFRGLLEINLRRETDDAEMGGGKPYFTVDVIKEVFRLYPPTRRIYRQYPEPTGRKQADLEQMHRNINLGGCDPEAFRPQRWVELKQAVAAHKESTKTPVKLKNVEEGFGFMPFAKVCPADQKETRAFGWEMVALLITGIIEGLDEFGEGFALRMDDEDDMLPAIGTALKSGREDYLSLKYCRVNPTAV
ncbi:uncharacterized protein AB675_9954 [Cyphellophora attinorum]|uniref:Uncharacterized protein n=1 Tax=Cyphellophora attinorum TaxID=1664694 RepID=A0A0N1H450_9EURO|nr:uncharacterized protein AB675_9954 [Phialophora attinorum]KPI35375.1 hypothetical protein AB675_9954 [Phialophora attinorum]